MKTLTLKTFFLFSVLLQEPMDSTLKAGNYLLPCQSQILNTGTMITLKESNSSVKNYFFIFLAFY